MLNLFCILLIINDSLETLNELFLLKAVLCCAMCYVYRDHFFFFKYI